MDSPGLPKRMLDASQVVSHTNHQTIQLLRGIKNIRKDGRLLLGKNSIDERHLTQLLASMV